MPRTFLRRHCPDTLAEEIAMRPVEVRDVLSWLNGYIRAVLKTDFHHFQEIYVYMSNETLLVGI
jgi:hypothetical protein